MKTVKNTTRVPQHPNGRPVAPGEAVELSNRDADEAVAAGWAAEVSDPPPSTTARDEESGQEDEQ